jgi:hypothetical protein
MLPYKVGSWRYNQTLHQPGKACQGQTLGPIRKFGRKKLDNFPGWKNINKLDSFNIFKHFAPQHTTYQTRRIMTLGITSLPNVVVLSVAVKPTIHEFCLC